MGIRKAVSRMIAALLPWPHRRERRAATAAAWAQRAAARAEAEESRRRAEHARGIAAELRKMARDNHFAESIARQIREGRSG